MHGGWPVFCNCEEIEPAAVTKTLVQVGQSSDRMSEMKLGSLLSSDGCWKEHGLMQILEQYK